MVSARMRNRRMGKDWLATILMYSVWFLAEAPFVVPEKSCP